MSNQKKHKVICTAPIPKPVLENLSQHCDLITYWDKPDIIPRQELLKKSSEAEGIFCVLSDKIDKEFIENAPNLKVISTMSVGFDHIDINECRKRGIKVGNTPGVLTEATADLILTLLLATARRIPEALNAVTSGSWPKAWGPEWMCGKDVFGSVVGIVGMGRIGSAVARRLKGFDCKLLYSGPSKKPDSITHGAEYVDFETLLKQCDFVVPCCPLNQSTTKLFNAETFKKMKKTAVFINATRGAVVDQDALVAALKAGEISACGLDVTTPEPLPLDNPLLSEELSSKVVIFPHIGSATTSTRVKMGMIAVDNLVAGLEDKPLPHKIL